MFTLPEPIPRKHQGLRHQRQAVWSCCPEQPWQEQSLAMSLVCKYQHQFQVEWLISHLWKRPLETAIKPKHLCWTFPIELLRYVPPLYELSSLRCRQCPLQPFSEPFLGHSQKGFINNTYIHNPALQAIWCVQGQTKKISCWMKWLSKVKCNPQALWRH